MITRIRIENFRSHERTEIALEPLTAFVGPCGVGKSNVFQALVLLQSLASRPLGECFFPGYYDFELARSLWLKGSESVAFEIDVASPPGFEGWVARYRVAITKGADVYQVTDERLDAEEPEQAGGRRLTCFHRRWRAEEHRTFGQVQAWDPTLLSQAAQLPGIAFADERIALARGVQHSISRLASYRPDPVTIGFPSTVETSQLLGYRGENLAACLNHLRLDRRDAFDRVVERMQSFLPNLEAIVVHRAPPGGITFSFTFRDFTAPVPAFLLSDGTRLSLAYVLISQLSAPPLILCLEEPENGYHPRRLRDLMDMFIDLAHPTDQREPVQVLVSTHSPYLLDLFSGELESCIRIVEMQDGRTEVTEWLTRKNALTPAQIEEGEEMPVGQLWAQGLYGGV